MNSKYLEKHGINYRNGVRRFMGNERAYESYLEQYTFDQEILVAQKAYDEKNFQNFFIAVHAIKGAAGNLELSEIYDCCCNLIELLRYQEYKKVSKSFLKLKKSIEYTKKIINTARKSVK